MKHEEAAGPKVQVGLFVKVPRVGRVKTRLGQSIGMRAAATFYADCVAWMLERLRGQRLGLELFYTPSDGEERLRSLYDLSGVDELRPQQGENLGMRMYNALVTLSEEGREKSLVLGSDVPDVPMNRLRRAADLLTENDLVVGPSHDGGYYLIGMNNPDKAVFKGIDWGGSTVLSETLERARREGLSHARLDSWNDLDRLGDFQPYRP